MSLSRANRPDPGRHPSDRGDAVPPGRLRVAAAQMVFESTVEGNLARIEAACSDAAREGADALLLPECATTGYAMESLQQPRFLAAHWRRMLAEVRRRVRDNDRTFQQGIQGGRDR